ncbi:MAG: HNH endonuclease [Proteobacteria bacterium]|nr:HNH endonuclease [Pseudomonadota bacterium]
MKVIALALALALLAPAAPARSPRSAAQLMAFKRANPCPETGLRRGSCPGYEVDHVMALCAGGADHPDNMQWLTVEQHRVKTRQDLRTCRILRKLKERDGP